MTSRPEHHVPPTRLSRTWVRYLLGFTVGVGVGLAPYLGILKVPLFAPLLGLIPDSLQDTLIPLSASLMGVIAVVVQWYGGERLSRRWLSKTFVKTLFVTGAAFLLLTVLQTTVVVRVPILGGDDAVSFLVGFVRPVKPPCTEEISDAECIKHISLSTSAVESFWGDGQIRLARISLMLSYMLFTGSFGALIGLIILRDRLAEKGGRAVRRG
jgi:hypothetical protein